MDGTLAGRFFGVSPDGRTEANLVERAKSDPEAFGELYETNYSRILNYIYRRTLDVAVAEELTSNTFFKAFRALPKYRRHAPFAAWLYRIATNEVRMHWRSERKRRAREQQPVGERDLERIYFTLPELEAKQEREERMRAYCRLRQCLRRLPERYQTVLMLRYFEALSYDDIAQVVGKRVGTVKSLLHRGLKRLRRLLEENDATFGGSSHYQ